MKNILLFMSLFVNNASDAEPKEFDSRELVHGDAAEGLKISFESSIKINTINAEGVGLGSGNLVSHKGEIYIITAKHVIDGTLFLQGVEKNGNILPLVVVYTDTEKDIALLKPLGKLTGTVPAKFKQRDNYLIGASVYHCGHPVGVFFNVSNGIVTSISKETYIINSFSLPGTSGAVVFDKEGYIVGVVVSILLHKSFGAFETVSDVVNVETIDSSKISFLRK